MSEPLRKRNLELTINLVKKTGASLLVLLVIDDYFCHYGEVDPLASPQSREDFVTYVLEEGLKEAQKRQAALKRQLSQADLSYRIYLKQGSLLKVLLETARLERVDLIVLEGTTLSRRAYRKLLREAPTSLLFL